MHKFKFTMEKYNFDQNIDRFGTNALKYDEMPSHDVIPLWVADMDFETAPVIRQALARRLEHGCFGYVHVPDSFYEATINWFSRRHGWEGIRREWFIYTIGVVPAISAIIKAMTTKEDKVLVMSPVYNCFFSSIRNNDCVILESPLKYTDRYYEVDWEDFEAKCKEAKVFVLCNPHNPACRVWTKDELHRMGEICKHCNTFVISDEIHCEFAYTRPYTPFMVASDAPCAVCVSPSKSFNIAGLQTANIIIPDAEVRAKVDKAININEVCDINPFGVEALQAAYSKEGEEWLNALNKYIYSNYEFACDFFEKYMPELPVTKLEGTYLLWVNIASTGKTAGQLCDELLHKANVYLNPGGMYGETTGCSFVRINLATQRTRLAEGLERIRKHLKE